MRNLIGNILIKTAKFITFLRIALLITITVSIVIGILMITIIGLFELMGSLLPSSEYQMVVLGKWYWCVIAVVLGGSTMWLGISKMVEEDKKYDEKKDHHFK